MTTFIRYFATTDGSVASELAWNFMRRMIRILPVRLCTLSGGLVGRWEGYNALLATPMTGDFVNVVCCDPARWTWIQSAAAPKAPPVAEAIAAGKAPPVEMLSSRAELWTKGVRNILIAATTPRSEAELETAKKYDAVIVTNRQHAEWFAGQQMHTLEIEHPYPEAAVRAAVLGEVG